MITRLRSKMLATIGFPFRLIIVISGFATALALLVAQLLPVAQPEPPAEI